jgi:His/Glu/Gln/Arg/opine family amino acid ABC transporter permease subunit
MMINNSSIRAAVVQALVVIMTVCVGYYLFSNVVENLRQMELPFGFGFVKSTAGFDVSWSLIPYDPSMSYGRVYLVGIVNTIVLSAMIIAFSTLLGFIVGILRLSRNFLVAQLARWYVEFFRNVPLLIQIVFWFIVVFSTLPAPRQSFGLFDILFLNNRGFYFPSPVFLPGFGWTLTAALFALACFCPAAEVVAIVSQTHRPTAAVLLPGVRSPARFCGGRVRFDGKAAALGGAEAGGVQFRRRRVYPHGICRSLRRHDHLSLRFHR